MKQIVIIGAGIIGATSAYNLQKSGAQVTVIDAGNANATSASFGWINASFFANTKHFDLRLEGIQAFHRLCSSLSLPVSWSGCLCWENTGQAFDDQLNELLQLGYEATEIDSNAFLALEPNIPNPPDRCLLFPGEAAAESQKLTKTLLNAAVELGANVLNGVEVLDFLSAEDRIVGVQTLVGAISADDVLICAGTATQKLAALLNVSVPMLQRPALVIRTRPIEPTLNHILASSFGEVRQLPDGSILMPTSVGHQGDNASDLAGNATILADQAMQRLRKLLPKEKLELAEVTLAHRPVPHDGLPVVGRVKPGAYIATMHSGVTLAALMGELITSEMIDGATEQSDNWLTPYRPERFAQ